MTTVAKKKTLPSNEDSTQLQTCFIIILHAYEAFKLLSKRAQCRRTGSVYKQCIVFRIEYEDENCDFVLKRKLSNMTV